MTGTQHHIIVLKHSEISLFKYLKFQKTNKHLAHWLKIIFKTNPNSTAVVQLLLIQLQMFVDGVQHDCSLHSHITEENFLNLISIIMAK